MSQDLRPRHIAVYVSAHGVGHAIRVAAVLEQLHRIVPLRLSVMASCNRRIWPASLAAITEHWHPMACDAGVIQSDDVTVDLAGTAAALEHWMDDLPATIDREAGRLESGFDLVVGDVPSPSFSAAKRTGIPSVAIANFSWDWIYSELGFRAAASASAAGYADATLLLECTPCGPMQAFPRRRNVGLVTRAPSRRRSHARSLLGVGDADSVVLLAFQPASAPTLQLPARRPDRCYLVPHGWPHPDQRGDVRSIPAELGFEDAIAACEVLVGKPGYGLLGDVEAAGARFLYVPRPGFPENAVLEDHLRERAGTASISAQQLAAGTWEEALAMLERNAAPLAADANGAVRAAGEIAVLLGVDTGPVTE